MHGSVGSGRMSGTAELLGIRSGTVARAVLVCGAVRCAESAAVSCRVTNRRQCRAIGLRLCRVSMLCRAVLLCCVGWSSRAEPYVCYDIMSYECYDLVLCHVECRPVWSVSCTLVSSRADWFGLVSRFGLRVVRIGVESC